VLYNKLDDGHSPKTNIMSVHQFALTGMFKAAFILLMGNGVWGSTCPCRDVNPASSYPDKTKHHHHHHHHQGLGMFPIP
jgi:hypothetical protein